MARPIEPGRHCRAAKYRPSYTTSLTAFGRVSDAARCFRQIEGVCGITLFPGGVEMRIRELGLAACVAAIVAATPALAEKAKKEAIIVAVKDHEINARTREGPLHVSFSPSTEIKRTTGVAQRKTADTKELIPGLIFTVEGNL